MFVNYRFNNIGNVYLRSFNFPWKVILINLLMEFMKEARTLSWVITKVNYKNLDVWAHEYAEEVVAFHQVSL